MNWLDIQKSIKDDPSAQVLFTLLTLNAIPASVIGKLQPADFDLAQNWVYLPNSEALPLVEQSQTLLSQVDLAEIFPFGDDQVQLYLAQWSITEEQLERRFAGAIWITSEEGQLILEQSGAAEAPILPLRFVFPFSVMGRLQPADEMARASRRVLQKAADWLERETLTPREGFTVSRIISILLQGRTMFLLISTGVNALNLLHNLLMGRLLPPADYGQLSLIITLQLLIGLVPTATQTVAARFSAGYAAQEQNKLLVALREAGSHFSWRFGTIIFLVLLALSIPLASIFQLRDAWLLLPIAIATPFFISMGTDRGVLQGLDKFYWLSGAYFVEGFVRLVVGVILTWVLLQAGRGLDGAVWAVCQAMVMTWFISWLPLRSLSKSEIKVEQPDEESTQWRQLTQFTLIALLGQALITNSDFLLVKTFFDATESGLYAAVTVLGRIAYFGALPLTVVMTPLIAKQQALGENTQRSFLLLMGGGVVLCGGLLFMAVLFAPLIIGLLYGEAYVSAAGLLPMYTVAASLFVLTNLAITYRVALGEGRETWMPLVAGVLQIIAILIFHNTLEQVIIVQIVLMSILLTGVLWRILR